MVQAAGSGFERIIIYIYLMVFLALTVGLIPFVLEASNTQASIDIDRLEGAGYVVLSAGEYAIIDAKLDALKVSADLAVTNAEAAVVAAQTAADKVDLFNSAEVYLFPTTSNLLCTLTAGNTNVWSAWVELEDSDATTLSSAFAVDAGYVSDMLFFLPSDAADGYNVELSYGVANTTLGRVSFYALASGDIAYVLPIKSRRVPAGETIYYRMQSTGANNATVQARLRYFYE
jgi:hypothetical protein